MSQVSATVAVTIAMATVGGHGSHYGGDDDCHNGRAVDLVAVAVSVMTAIRHGLWSAASLAWLHSWHACHPSLVRAPLVNRRRHAKMPSTRLVPAMLQIPMMQRGRSWEGMLQRLSVTSEPEVKGTPDGVDERGEAMFGAAGRRTVNEEQNSPSQDLTRVSRKNTDTKT